MLEGFDDVTRPVLVDDATRPRAIICYDSIHVIYGARDPFSGAPVVPRAAPRREARGA